MEADELLRQIGSGLPEKDRADLTRNAFQYRADNLAKIWTTVVQAIVAVALVIGGYFTYRNLRVTQERLDVDRQAQITNRFTQAIGQLGSELKDGDPNLEVHLGGIYALEKIAQDEPEKYHWTIMEILTAYVRQNAPWMEPSVPDGALSSSEMPREELEKVQGKPKVRTDVQAILTVLGRREQTADRRESGRLDLHGTDLRGADLRGAHLERADLFRTQTFGTHLEGPDLRGAHLEGADLSDAHLERADLRDAHLDRAVLFCTHLERADLRGVRLNGADLRVARLNGADLRVARLEGADLRGVRLFGAHLEGVDLRGVRLEGATLRGAHLEEADLRFAQGLTPEQVGSASEQGEGALLPAEWPTDWRDRLHDSTETAAAPPAESSAP